jgi:hypothetical protein
VYLAGLSLLNEALHYCKNWQNVIRTVLSQT